jgi:hypothetical protein
MYITVQANELIFFVDDRGLLKLYIDKDKHMETLCSVLPMLSTKKYYFFTDRKKNNIHTVLNKESL